MTRKIKVFTLNSSADVDTVNRFLKMHPQAKLSYVTSGSYLCSYDALVIADYEDDEEDDEMEAKQ
ncbi:hypothetical protein OK107_08525 [Lacticaseibacillus paracasei]|uniref:hypothetical protein n=1 Tax=Lacticaseibacillus paracasei TaxID=1597 RepID=UPI0022EC71EF|nr:hypothetical protein [Lacticaseibacillus paracasei]WBS98115.1 hypothetical protein OK107_08525 [Lacticaseibacillus paracasei]